MTSYDAAWRHFGTCRIYHLSFNPLWRHRTRIFSFTFSIVWNFKALAFIWGVNHWFCVKIGEDIRICFYLENFVDFTWFWLILAQILLTSSLFSTFFDFSRQESSKWTFSPKMVKTAFYLKKIMRVMQICIMIVMIFATFIILVSFTCALTFHKTDLSNLSHIYFIFSV